MKMKQPISLRKRIIRATLALTVVICLLFTTGIFLAFEIAEESLFEEHLETDLNSFIEQYAVYPDIANLPHRNFQVYISKKGDLSEVPEYITRGLPDIDDIVRDGKHLDLEIRESGDTTFYFVLEETDMDRFEVILVTSVILIVLIICIAALMLAATFANRIIKPVTVLADRVNSLERQGSDNATDAAEGDEIAVLTQAIDEFQGRVHELLQREREFSSDASHELRTPLMAIQAAAENLSVSSNDSVRVAELARRIESRCMVPSRKSTKGGFWRGFVPRVRRDGGGNWAFFCRSCGGRRSGRGGHHAPSPPREA